MFLCGRFRLSNNLTLAGGSTSTTIISILTQVTSNPSQVTGSGYTTALNTVQNVLNNLIQITNNNVNNPNNAGSVSTTDQTGVVNGATQTGTRFLPPCLISSSVHQV
jgi:hypothetical protein